MEGVGEDRLGGVVVPAPGEGGPQALPDHGKALGTHPPGPRDVGRSNRNWIEAENRPVTFTLHHVKV